MKRRHHIPDTRPAYPRSLSYQAARLALHHMVVTGKVSEIKEKMGMEQVLDEIRDVVAKSVDKILMPQVINPTAAALGQRRKTERMLAQTQSLEVSQVQSPAEVPGNVKRKEQKVNIHEQIKAFQTVPESRTEEQAKLVRRVVLQARNNVLEMLKPELGIAYAGVLTAARNRKKSPRAKKNHPMGQ